MCCAGAAAQEGHIQSFDQSYLEQFAPQTAREALRAVPGFSVRRTGGGRGLGQGGVNVLINGERVTSKDTDALEILEQTPASAVVRIELADSATLGVTGLTGQVANVVIDRSQLSGSWEWTPLFRHAARPRLNRAALSVVGAVGKLDYSVGIDHRAWRGTEEGFEQRLLADGTLVEERFENERTRLERPTLQVDLGYQFNPKTSLAVTGSVSSFSFERREDSFGPDDTRIASSGEDEWSGSLSTELRRDLGPGTLRLIGYKRHEDSPFTSRTSLFETGEDDVINTFQSDQLEGETIGRAEYAWSRPGNVTWEAAVETAFNFLEVDNVFTQNTGGVAATTVSPTVRVEEIRHQGSVTRGFSVFEKLTVQASVAAEWSRLTVEGEGGDNREEEFLRPKGSITLSYPVAPKFDVRGRIERAVGQLNFGDFVDSVDLTEDRDFAGNRGLVPQQSWQGEIELEQRFGENEKIIVRVVGELIEDRVDRVLIDGADAVGNIDEAKAVTFETEGSFVTDRWNVPGGRIDFNYSRFGSEIDDPITGDTRGFNGAQDWNYSVSFRQDIPSTPYAWRISAEHADEERIARFNETLLLSRSTPQYDAFVEHKDFFGMNLRVGVQNIANSEFDVERIRFAGLRTTAPIDVVERRIRDENQRFFFRFTGTF